MAGGVFTRIVIEALLGFHGVSQEATAYVAGPTVRETQNGQDLCGWAGVTVSPMTAAFADSLGMADPYGAIFDQPEPGGPAATAGIEQGDVLTAINGSPLMRASDFAKTISMMAPGTSVYLNTSRNGEIMQITLILASSPCRSSG
ncbi:MAG TPA: PDZ domain-containing protein [Xanthobacteraceae bacterium]|nr:PDZ domain-containing protein [Xanthobacteraceae bacterium]